MKEQPKQRGVIMNIQRYSNVWDAISDTNMQSANLKMRADLMVHISQIIQKNGWTQAQAASYCHISQPRINDLLTGKIDKFSLDALVNINAHLGQSIHLQFTDMQLA